MNPRLKLKVQVDNVTIDKQFKKKYDANKYEACQKLKAFLNNSQQEQDIQPSAKYYKDVADAVLQCIYYQYS